ncbi:MAG TPA: RNA methyltransferase [Bdellovibrionales bacterium]|nr:RNA methyltransferase [Bdellovibrionales bacterium]
MTLSPGDQKRLAKILRQARELESEWPEGDRNPSRDLSVDERYQALKRDIRGLVGADAESLRRLATNASHFHDRISRAHFYAFVVPFERLSGKSLRDDEFLVHEGDTRNGIIERVPLKVIVENMRSAFNVGAIFRTSECLGVSEILLCGYSPTPEDDKTLRTAMGTDSIVPWRRMNRAKEACEKLRAEGYKVIALETAANSTLLHDYEFDDQPVAFVVGNERFGIEHDTLAAVDAVCRIPVRGIKNSLNVGVAFGIGAFEWLRQYQRVKR